MQHPQPDDSAWQTGVVHHREVTGLWVGIVARELRFMHQRRDLPTRLVVQFSRGGNSMGHARLLVMTVISYHGRNPRES